MNGKRLCARLSGWPPDAGKGAGSIRLSDDYFFFSLDSLSGSMISLLLSGSRTTCEHSRHENPLPS